MAFCIENSISGKKFERKICETQSGTCQASESCPDNTDDSNASTDGDGGADVDDGKCWREYIGFHVRNVHAPSPFGGKSFDSLDEGKIFCKEKISTKGYLKKFIPKFT